MSWPLIAVQLEKLTKEFDAANAERQAAVDMVENGQVPMGACVLE